MRTTPGEMEQNTKKADRFVRIQRLLGDEKCALLQQSFVTVVGIGAVGGYAVEALARAGVGRLRLVDFDILQPSNINRQILALESSLGRTKAEAAGARVRDINPQCRVEVMQEFAGEESVESILTPAPDLLIDAIDSLNPKVQLLTAAYHRDIPILSSMGASLRTDPTQIRVTDLMSTSHCPLARRLRQRLKRHGVTGGIRCVFSTEKVDFAYDEPEQQPAEEHPFDDRGRTRRVLGSLPTLPGIFGLTLANEALLRLSGHREVG